MTQAIDVKTPIPSSTPPLSQSSKYRKRESRLTRRLRFLRKLALWMLLFLPLLYLSARFVVSRRIVSWRTKGIVAAEAGDPFRASELLVRYLRRRPQDKEALACYIKVRELAELPDGQHFAETIGALKLYLALDPGALDEHRHLLSLYVKLQRWPEALDASKAILSRYPTDMRTLQLQTEVLGKIREYHEALKTADKWAQVAPTNLEAQMARLSMMARLEKAPALIIDNATHLREKYPADLKFEILQGFAYSLTGDDGLATQWLKTAAAHVDITDDLAQILVAQFDNLGLADDSLRLLERQVARQSGTQLRYSLARRLWERSDWTGAAAHLKDLNPDDPNSDIGLLAFRTIAASNTGNTADAARCRTALAVRKQAAARAWSLLLGRINDGADVDDKELSDLCRDALASNSADPYLSYYFGDSLARLGELDQAIAAWRRSASLNATWNVPAVRLVEALLQKSRPEQAMDIAFVAARRNPNSAAAVVSLARAWAAGIETGGVGQADQLLKLVEQVRAQLPSDDRTLLIQVQLLAQQGRKQEASSALASGLDRTSPPLTEQAFLTLAMMSRKFNLGAEERCFKGCAQAHGQTASLTYARAVHQLLSGHSDAGLRAFDEAATRAGKSNDPSWRLARVQFQDVANDPGAGSAWVALGDAFPKDLAVQQSAADARAAINDRQFVERTVSRLRDLTGAKAFSWRVAKARLLVEAARDEADYEQGALLLNELLQESPSLVEAHILLARTLVHMKRQDGAIEHFSAAARLDPTNVPVALQLASLLQSRGDFERVRLQLDRISPSLQASRDRQQAAMLLAKQGAADRALQILERGHEVIEAIDQSRPDEDLLLGMLYRQQGRLDDAEVIARRLLAKPDLAGVQFAASVYTSLARPADAKAALAKLDAMTLPDGLKEMALGSCAAESNDLSAAIAHYKKATEQSPSNPVAWRVLATCHAGTGNITLALSTVAEALKQLPADPDLKAIAAAADLITASAGDDPLRPVLLVLFHDPLNSPVELELLQEMRTWRSSPDRERLAGRLHQLLERHSASVPVQLQLIRCYREMGRLADALAISRRSMYASPADPLMARLTTELAANGGKWEEARDAAEIWKKRDPTAAPDADLAVARANLALQQPDFAAQRLQPYVSPRASTTQPAATQPSRQPQLLATYAAAMVIAGRQDEAAAALQNLFNRSPEAAIAWAGAALQIPDPVKATAWLDRLPALTAAPLEVRVAIAEANDMVGRRDKDAKLVSRSSELFKAIAADPSVTAPAILGAAAQAERAGDAAAAERLYRRALSMNADLWIAHNNLAVIIVNRRGDAADALAHASAAVRLQPYAAAVYDTLATAQALAGDTKASIDTVHAAIRLDPDNPSYRVRLAQYFLDSGRVVEAGSAVTQLDGARLNLATLPATLQQQLANLRRQTRGGKL